MKKLAILFVFMLLATAGFSQSMSTIAKGFPLNSNSGSITGFGVLATPTIAISDAAQIITVNSPLPAGTVAVTLVARNGVVNYGGSDVLTSTNGFWPSIASGSFVTIPIYPGTTRPAIYVVNNATGSAAVTVRVIPQVQK